MVTIKSELAEETTFHPIKPGLYIARINNVELKESKKWQSDEVEEKLVFGFGLIKNAMSKKDVEDVEGEVFAPLKRKQWKWCNTKYRYAWGGAIELTITGNIMEACGVKDVADLDEYNMNGLISQIVVVKIENKKTEAGVLKDKITDVSPFDGDMAEVERWIADAMDAEADSTPDTVDLPFDEPSKKN